MFQNSRQIERLSKLSEQVQDDGLAGTTIEERWNIMWQLTINAWAMRGDEVAGQKFQRHVECLTRLGSDE